MDSLNRAIHSDSPFTANLSKPRLHSPLPTISNTARLHSPLPTGLTQQTHTQLPLGSSPGLQFRSLAHGGSHSPSIHNGLTRHYGLHNSSSMTDLQHAQPPQPAATTHHPAPLPHSEPHDSTYDSQQQSQTQMSEAIVCPHCSMQLVLGRPSQLVACPRCLQVFDPHAHRNAICIGCNAQLAYPANAQYIQCPKCNTTMKAPDVHPQERLQHLPHDQISHIQHNNIASPSSTYHQPSPQSIVSQPHVSHNIHMPQPHHPHMSPNHQPNRNTSPSVSKKRKDHNAPKAVVNAYMIFCKMRRGELKRKYPELPFGKIGAKLGEIWRTMSTEEKKPYEDRATLDRERYRKEMMDYSTVRGTVDGYVSPPPSRKHKDDTLYRAFDADGNEIFRDNDNDDTQSNNLHDEQTSSEDNNIHSTHLHDNVEVLSHAADSVNEADPTIVTRPITPLKHKTIDSLKESNSTNNLAQLHSITPQPDHTHNKSNTPLPYIKTDNQSLSSDEPIRTDTVEQNNDTTVKKENLSKPSPMTSSVNALLFAAEMEKR